MKNYFVIVFYLFHFLRNAGKISVALINKYKQNQTRVPNHGQLNFVKIKN